MFFHNVKFFKIILFNHHVPVFHSSEKHVFSLFNILLYMRYSIHNVHYQHHFPLLKRKTDDWDFRNIVLMIIEGRRVHKTFALLFTMCIILHMVNKSANILCSHFIIFLILAVELYTH